MAGGRALVDWLIRSALAERERWIVWLAVAFAGGIGAYFALPYEPPRWIVPAAIVALGALVWLGRRRQAALISALPVLAGLLGFAAAQGRTAIVDAPVLETRLGVRTVDGVVHRAEPREHGIRLWLSEVAIEGRAAAYTPERVRLAVRTGGPAISPGDRVRLRAVLLPPPGPVAPGAFDFQRRAYFLRIGAVGFAVSEPEILSRAQRGGAAAWLAALRHRVTARILNALPGERGAVAAALLTGERGRIGGETMQAIRDAGLAHLLAISGLHVGMVMLLLMAALRLGLAAVPRIALRADPKKWAAVGALVGGLIYVLLSGATVPTLRAFAMFAAAMAGVLIDREGLSLRLVALAAVLVLTLAPESLLGPSFQMSFAAAIALIAAYDAWQRYRQNRPVRNSGLVGRAGRGAAAIGFTTIVATAATAPFAIFHFNRLAVYGLAANMIAVPITAFWILPWGIASLFLMPVGLEHLPLAAMGLGIDLMLSIARAVAAWPGAVTLVPPLSTAGLLAVALGGLWLTLWRTRWRFAGLPVIAAGFLSIGAATPPDMLISEDGGLVAVRTPSGRLSLSSARRARFSAEIWLRRAAQAEAASWPRGGTAADGRVRCDALGCVYHARGRIAAIVRDPSALAEDCRRADLVITEDYLRLRCPAAERVIDRFQLWRNGSHAVWFEETGIRVLSDRHHRGDRPWVLDPYEAAEARRRADAEGARAGPTGAN